jgi:prepilin-type N-terminal cleavage/methylation domain-containing protein
MERFRNPSRQGGFTLIEMAIVLVIIGLILGAILKGQDLITSARGKRFASFVRSAETAQWAHLDRYGKFNSTASDLASRMDTFKNETIALGGDSLTLSFVNGNKTIQVNATNGPNEDVGAYYEAFDTSIDGQSDYDDGLVHCNGSTSWEQCQSLDYDFD